jgi:hypothetical protein
MKNMKRAYRRYKKQVHLKRRAEKNYYWLGFEEESKAEFIKKVLHGEIHTWLRHTGRPCNCSMCSRYDKYQRPTIVEEKKIIDEQLE